MELVSFSERNSTYTSFFAFILNITEDGGCKNFSNTSLVDKILREFKYDIFSISFKNTVESEISVYSSCIIVISGHAMS